MAGVSPTEGPGTRQQRISALMRQTFLPQPGMVRATACACAAGPSHACGTKDIRAGKNINHLLAHLSTRKCNFKESEAAKEMAKTDDNVKEFLEKCVQGGEHILGWCVVWSGHAFMLDAVHTDDASVTALFMKEKLDLILDNLTFNGKCMGHLSHCYPPCPSTTSKPPPSSHLPTSHVGASLLSALPLHLPSSPFIPSSLAPPFISCSCRLVSAVPHQGAHRGSQGPHHVRRHSTAISDLLRKQRKDSGSKQKLQPPSLELGRGSWLLASLELGRGSWLLVSLELGRGSWLLVSLELGRGSWLLVSLELGRGSWLLPSLELGRGSWRLGKVGLQPEFPVLASVILMALNGGRSRAQGDRQGRVRRSVLSLRSGCSTSLTASPSEESHRVKK
ncbi:hypothetical protein QJQ45_018539 [Haematococcus lacustris]|nr:hypothetical protein QJQ45_018539 [Haematococcus lacustris]